MAVLHDPWTGVTVHDDQLPSPIVASDDNGDYIITRANGKSTYKKYAPKATDVLPAYPSANGTYVLTATKSNSGVTLSWESAE